MNNEFGYECFEEAVRLLNAHPIRQEIDDSVSGHRYSIPGLSGMKFLAHHVCAIWFIVKRWVSDADMPEALVADEIGHGKTFTSVAAAMIWKLPTEKVVMELLLSISWANTLADWVNMVQNNFPGIIGEKLEWYSMGRHNSVPRCLIEIQKTPPQGHPALTSALELFVVVTMQGVAETFKSVIDKMTSATDFKLINLLHAENANVIYEDLNTSHNEPKDRSNIHLVSYDTITSRVKPSSNGQLSHSSWSFGTFDESHR